MSMTIGELVGFVSLNTAGVRKGAAETRATMAGLGQSMDRAAADGARGFSGLGSSMRGLGLSLGALGIGTVGKQIVGLEADFSKNMALIAESTSAPKAELRKMRTLAMDLGKDTSFSSSEAAGAMLELAKAGISTSDIMGGALSGTLTLAAAGGTDLATASTIASNAMNTFGMSGKDMNAIAAALAGGANASSASVESLGMALSQVGPGATNAGMSLQQTVGVLAAFDSAGIKGSDAGTSLKTMLANLIPTTDAAKNAMRDLGLKFTDAKGQFLPITNIAQQLKTKLGGLSEAQRATALQTIFGSDASRAATVLMKEGAEGVRKYIKATRDQGAAQRMAKANTSGTAGAIERMKGSIETAGLAFGTLLAPATQKVADLLGGAADKASEFAGWMGKNKPIVAGFAAVMGILTAVTVAHGTAMSVAAAGGMAKWLMQTKIISTATKVWTAVQWAFNAAMAANPIGLAVIAIAALVAAFVIAWKKSETFRQIVTGALDGVKAAAEAVGRFFTDTVPAFFTEGWDKAKGAFTRGGQAVLGFLKKWGPTVLAVLTGPIGLAVLAIAKNWDKIKAGASSVVDWIKGIPAKIGALGARFGGAGRQLLQSFIDGMRNAAGIISGIAGNVWNAVKGLLNGAIGKINAALEFKISLPGPDISINPPDIPKLATGGRATGATLAVFGEGREAETVLPDSMLRGLLERVHESGMAAGAASREGAGMPMIGQVVQQPGESAENLAERLYFVASRRPA